MPRALEPGVTFDVVLDYDKEKPLSERPAFIYRSLNCREWTLASGFFERSSGGNAEQFTGELIKSASVGLVGWKNMADGKGDAIAFDLDKLPEIVTPFEARELIDKVTQGNVPDADAKKNSDSPASPATD